MLDILSDLIRSYGNPLSPFHEPLLKALMPLLVDPKPVSVRKRAYTALCEYYTTGFYIAKPKIKQGEISAATARFGAIFPDNLVF